jgi:hypothetical protein
MYRISLYPEFGEKRRQVKRRTLHTALFGILIGVETLLVGALVVSALLLGEQANVMREGYQRLASRVQGSGGPRPELAVAREMLFVRANRIDWSPKLAALSERIPPSLILKDVNGHSAAQRSAPQLEMTGEVHSGVMLEQVSRFIQQLSEDPRMTTTFPSITLGTIGGGGVEEFQVVCKPPEDKP